MKHRLPNVLAALTLLGLGLGLGVGLGLEASAQASQTLTGDMLRVHYGDEGIWYDTTADLGVQTDFEGDGDWLEWIAVGSAQQVIALEWDQSGSAHSGYGNYVATSWTTTSESDLSTSTTLYSEHVWELEDLTISKSESWAVDSTIIYVQLEISNGGSDNASNLRTLFWLDGDQDDPVALETDNDVQDLDADGVDDWVQAVGPDSAYTVGLGACEETAQELGSTTEFSSDVDVTMLDDDGSEHDRPINLRHTVGDLAAGDTVRFGFFVSLATTATDAQTAYSDRVLDCVNCDDDGDAALDPTCGGDDCDDDDGLVYPGATDSWYDGVDSDCAGDSDYDADTDGHDSDAYGGDDCDDADASIWTGCVTDTGTIDTGTTDGGTTDGGTTDGGTTDGGTIGGTSGGTDTGSDIKGEGCACSTGGSGLAAGLWLGLIGMIVGSRRRSS